MAITVRQKGPEGGSGSSPGYYWYEVNWDGALWSYKVSAFLADKAYRAFKHHKSQKKLAAALKKNAEVAKSANQAEELISELLK